MKSVIVESLLIISFFFQNLDLTVDLSAASAADEA